MSKNTILIHTQYEENYGHYEGNFHWKKKGGHTFSIELDADIMMYSDASSIFKKMLLSQSNDLERFTYMEHEVQWEIPPVLGTQDDYINTNRELNPEMKI